QPDIYEDFYRCTTTRWLYNEDKQLALRYVKFNVPELQKVATDAVGARACLSMEPIREGSYNKMFLLTFDNGREAIARIPCPIAGPAHLTVASEVATLDFARTRLKLSVPKVLAWSSRVSKATYNVGAEYIIMEKIPGIPLADRWDGIQGPQTLYPTISAVVDIEKKFSAVRFSQIGSLYIKEDVEPHLQQRRLYAADVPDDESSEKYRVGPTLQRVFWRGERMDMDLDRGPWPDTLSYARALVQCEQQWIKTYARPRSSDDPFRVSDEEESLSMHLELLNNFMSTVPSVIPDSEANDLVLWHTDLHDGNVIVHPETLAINGLVDWQHLWIGPRFLRATFSRIFAYERGKVDLNATPVLPPNLKELPVEEQAEIKLQYNLAARHMLYLGAVKKADPLHYRILTKAYFRVLVILFITASRSWSDTSTALRHPLMQFSVNWTDWLGPDVPCPLSFTDDEIETHQLRYEQAQRYLYSGQILSEALEIGPDGSVNPEHYEDRKAAAERARAVWDDEESGGRYPLQDGGWSSLF
ncbi:hypothetical protein BOTBODRAFT_108923, partial [Botryobasidium botryosum FD-172 SS1]